MKKIFSLIAFVFFVQAARSQIFIRPNQSYGLEYFRSAFDSTVYIPTGSGAPVGKAGLRSYGFAGAGQTLKMSALYYDSTNKILYAFSPKDSSWSPAGGGTIVDTSLFLRKALNLSEVASISSARTNLGLGSLALLNTINNSNWSGTPLSPGNGGTGLNALGTAFQMLRVNSGATALEYFTPTFQPQLNGTGFVKASGTTISYDNSNYISALTGDGTASGPGSAALTLTSVISAGSCTLCNLTWDAKGRLLVAANGASSGTTWSGVIGGSSATNVDLTIPNSGAAVQYVYNGTVNKTFTLPAFSSNGNRAFFFKNAGTANLIVARGGTDTIYTDSKVANFTLTPGQSGFVISSPFYWYAYLNSGQPLFGVTDILATSNRQFNYASNTFVIRSSTGAGNFVLSNLGTPAKGDSSYMILQPDVVQFGAIGATPGFHGSSITIDTTHIDFTNFDGNYSFAGMIPETDTTTWKPGVLDASGHFHVLSYWPGAGGGTNFSNTDLTFDASHTHDVATHNLTIQNAQEIQLRTASGTVSSIIALLADDPSASWSYVNSSGSITHAILMDDTKLRLRSTDGTNVADILTLPDGTIRFFPQNTPSHSAGEVVTLVNPATGEWGWLPNPANLARQNITTGGSSTLSSGNLLVQFDFSSAAGTYDLTLPASPNDKDIIEIQTGKTISGGSPEITTFTLIPNGSQTLNFAAPVATLNSGESIIIMYNSSGDFWSRRN